MPTKDAYRSFPNRIKRQRQSFAFRERHDDEQGSGERKQGTLPRQAVLLLAVQGLFAAAGALSGAFVNVYLWKVSQNFAVIGWFALSAHFANVLTFYLAGKWVKEFNKMNSLRAGVALSAVFYLIVLLLKKQAVHYVVPLGALQGIAGGLFWLAFNVVYFEITEPDNRDKFNGYAGLLGSITGMIAPWISGFIITRMEDTAGYRIIFTVSLIIFLIGVATSFFLKKRKAQDAYSWTKAFRNLKDKGDPWRRAFPALMGQGMREGVFAFVIGLLVYIATQNEMKLGIYSFITSGVALFSFMLAGKWLKPHRRNLAMLIGTAAMILVILPFFWKVNYATLMFFGIGTSLFIPLFTIPMTSSVFDIIGRNQDSADHRVEYVVLREVGLNAGRIIGTILFLIAVSISTKPLMLNSLLLLVGSAPMLSWFLMRSWQESWAKKQLNENKN